MKRILLLLLAALLLAACSDEPTAEPEEVETAEETSASNEPTQEELNAQLKEEATEIEFVKANGDEVEQDAKVKVTGEVSNLVDDTMVEFTLKTEEGEGFGMYSVKGFNTTETSIEDGQTVTVYGTYAGKNDVGIPEINMTIIE